MDEKSLYKLVNPSFTFEFGGKVFEVKKANLQMAVQYQTRIKELKEKSSTELLLVSYCIYLVLNKADSTITEDWVIENTPADIDVLDCLARLGFINQNRLEIAKKIKEEVEKKSTTENSL